MNQPILFVLILLFVTGIDATVNWVLGASTSTEFVLLVTVFIYLDITKKTKQRWD